MKALWRSSLPSAPELFPVTAAANSQHRAADFADDRPGAYFVSATGRWLDSPVAVLKATSGGRAVSVLVRGALRRCVPDADLQGAGSLCLLNCDALA